MTPAQFDEYERHWKRVFAVAAGILVVCLIDLVAFAPRGVAGFVVYTTAGLAVIVCIWAGKKLRDPERIEATADGSWLKDVYRPTDLSPTDVDLHDD